MSTYVLVGGAWLGAWAWREVTERLWADGHRVYPLTLTGLADRSHLGGIGIDVDTHVMDIVNLIETEELDEVVLAGHSYAGMVPVPAAAHRIGDRLSHVVYIDSAPLADKMAMTDVMPPQVATEMTAAVDAHGDGWRLEFPSPEELAKGSSIDGLTDQMLERFRRRATPHPFGTYTNPVTLPGDPAGAPEVVLVACHDMRRLFVEAKPMMERMTDPNWRRFDLETGHWPMLSQPAELAEVLARVPSQG